MTDHPNAFPEEQQLTRMMEQAMRLPEGTIKAGFPERNNMAKKLTVTASKNGGVATTQDIFMRNTDPLDLGPLFCFRLWNKFDKGLDDILEVSTITIQLGIADPMAGFDDPDWYRQISLAFID